MGPSGPMWTHIQSNCGLWKKTRLSGGVVEFWKDLIGMCSRHCLQFVKIQSALALSEKYCCRCRAFKTDTQCYVVPSTYDCWILAWLSFRFETCKFHIWYPWMTYFSKTLHMLGLLNILNLGTSWMVVRFPNLYFGTIQLGTFQAL